MAFVRQGSDIPFNIYRCTHVPTGAIAFVRVAANSTDNRAVVRHIQQNLKRPVTSRSPEDRKAVARFVETNRLELTATGIDRDWAIEIIETIPECLVNERIAEHIVSAIKAKKVVLGTTEKCGPKPAETPVA